VRRDSDHEAAPRWKQQNRQLLVTTDYVVDELLILLTVREIYCLALAASERLWQRQGSRITRGMCSVSLALNAIGKTAYPRLPGECPLPRPRAGLLSSVKAWALSACRPLVPMLG
jgi:hypothetical protein